MRIRYASYLSLAIAAAFLIFATAAFSLSTVAALALGIGIGMLAVGVLAIAGVTAHELGAERVVHSLEVHEGERDRRPVAA